MDSSFIVALLVILVVILIYSGYTQNKLAKMMPIDSYVVAGACGLAAVAVLLNSNLLSVKQSTTVIQTPATPYQPQLPPSMPAPSSANMG